MGLTPWKPEGIKGALSSWPEGSEGRGETGLGWGRGQVFLKLGIQVCLCAGHRVSHPQLVKSYKVASEESS